VIEGRIETPSQASGPSEAAFLHQVLDELVAEHTTDELAVVAARKLFEERRGRVLEDEELWEVWSAGFVEWRGPGYAADGDGLPAAVGSLGRARAAGETRRAAAIRAWLTSHRSLWSVDKLGAGYVELFDLLGGARVRVAESRALHGVAIGEIAELRVVGFEGEVRFGRAFLFHPRGTRDALIEQARLITGEGGDRRAVLDHAATLRGKVLRYRHVPPARLYEDRKGVV